MGLPKGRTNNPNGRPRSPEIEIFRQALEEVEKKKNKTLLHHAVERAFADDGVLVALVKKMVPDKISHEGHIDQVSPEQRQKLIDEVKKYLSER